FLRSILTMAGTCFSRFTVAWRSEFERVNSQPKKFFGGKEQERTCIYVSIGNVSAPREEWHPGREVRNDIALEVERVNEVLRWLAYRRHVDGVPHDLRCISWYSY